MELVERNRMADFDIECDYQEWIDEIFDWIREEWYDHFEFNRDFLESADEALKARERPITPRGLEIFTAFQWVDPMKVKVVIVGQDPYPPILDSGETKAVGASFSLRDYDKPTKSLITIYKELADDIEGFIIPSHGNLKSWAEQGVMLLNSSLTTDVGMANQHEVQWRDFVDATVRYLEENNPHLCYIMWGAEARKLRTGSKFMKFCGPHPASRSGGFAGCKHFSKVNNHLRERGLDPIDWTSICPPPPKNARTSLRRK